jgi:hypothetical protein
MDERDENMQTLNRMPIERNAVEDESFESQCVIIEESVRMVLDKYLPELRELKRKKREAKDCLARMKYHAKNALFHIGKFEEYLS